MTPLPDLSAVLNSLPYPTILLDREYRILIANEQYRKQYGFSDKPKQHLCYEISHKNSVPCDLAGEACPIQDSLQTGEKSRVLHIHHTPRGKEYVNVELWPVKDPVTGTIQYFIEQMCPSQAASTKFESDNQLVGSSHAFQAMLNLIERVSRSTTNVMLLGESGTGKDLAAQTLHRLSDRRAQPFVAVECTGLPDALFESELFGYVKGAFTGATTKKTGLVAAAESGTLFLDEVGEIPLSDQVKLLRLLETRRYRQVGSSEWQEADFRLVCATNRDLSAMVADGTFREDLYYRLNVFEIQLPPLRDSINDLPVLIDTMLTRLNANAISFDADALACLQQYDFPGNVRELRNIVERAVLLTDDGVVHRSHLPQQCQHFGPTEPEVKDEIVSLEEAEHRYLQRALSQHSGSRKDLALHLGIGERVLYRKIAELKKSMTHV